MKVKSLGIELSPAFLGYIDQDCIRPIDSNTDDKCTIFLTCTARRDEIYKLNKTRFNRVNGSLEVESNRLFEYFPGYVSKNHNNQPIFGGQTFWETLMANSIGDETIWCVNDGSDDKVYLMHSWKATLYHLGRIHKGHQLEKACHWRYKRLKI